MKLSPLQVARYQYSPKLPGMLRNGISDICVCSGGATESVADQEKIKALFPNTYGKNEITFQKGKNTSAPKKQIVGVILSGGQAPGGHNVICGLYDALKAKTGIALDKRKIVLNETIKTVGTYTATCKLGYEITAPLTVKIEEA